ncbi:MAG: hypothetical protein C4530_19305 [Desulfobacteraceae bacterium]|nr:MAG: hypothetical protein C4530_19305 [Desulfobacteraceae bacterium]
MVIPLKTGLQKLGIVTNIWTKRLEKGDRFEDLAGSFRDQGFRLMELRDSPEFRSFDFGRLLQEIEEAMSRYTGAQWKRICENRDRLKSSEALYSSQDSQLFHRVAGFFALCSDITFSYAIPHAWMTAPHDAAADSERIARAKKTAYLLSPADARLRLVDPDFSGPAVDAAAVANLERYLGLAPELPVCLCVENAKLAATLTLKLAVQAGVSLAYDEANLYNNNGDQIESPVDFWNFVKPESLSSVHIKQKKAEGVTPRIEDGYVDFRNILMQLKKMGYSGDLLFENAPSEQPLEDAVSSRRYLLDLPK